MCASSPCVAFVLVLVFVFAFVFSPCGALGELGVLGVLSVRSGPSERQASGKRVASERQASGKLALSWMIGAPISPAGASGRQRAPDASNGTAKRLTGTDRLLMYG